MLHISIQTEIDRHPQDSLEAKVLGTFLQQPSQIGPGIGMLRSLDLKNPDDRAIFLKGVREDIDRIKAKIHFQEHALLEAIYENGLTLLDR